MAVPQLFEVLNFVCELLNLQSTNEHTILLKFAEFPVLEPISGLLVKFQAWRKVSQI